jgi:hypothetical protein
MYMTKSASRSPSYTLRMESMMCTITPVARFMAGLSLSIPRLPHTTLAARHASSDTSCVVNPVKMYDV